MKVSNIKKILAEHNVFIEVKQGEDFALEMTEDNTAKTLIIPEGENSLNEFDVYQRAYTATTLELNNIQCDYNVFGLLHEIGHIKSNYGLDLDEYLEDCENLIELLTSGTISKESFVFSYNELEMEQKANEWAVNWLKKHQNRAIMYEKLLK